ncbi:hypothetical protein [Fodinicola acaciae]|uniref:hypothetical protein n=1 Tax=Fodinicola acaciae TaxID=2681555 RepID=UPI0013D75A40|nr:hypothetical protein [Fodinicola acaciae]
MDQSRPDVLGETACLPCLRRSCELLLQQLDRFEDMVSEYDEHLTAGQLEAIAAADDRYGSGAKEHLELATKYTDEWFGLMQMVLTHPNL